MTTDPTIRITLAQPTGETIDRRHLQCLEQFEQHVVRQGIPYERTRASGSSLLEHTRSELATKFYDKEDASHDDVLLFVDSDMTFEPASLLELCKEAHQRSAIVGGVSMSKKPLGEVNTRFEDESERIGFFAAGDVIPVKRIGTGVMAIPRMVLGAIVQHDPHCQKVTLTHGNEVYPFFRSLIINGMWWGEDMSFCYRAQQAGCSIFADTRARIGHRGPYEFNLEDSGQAIELKNTLYINLVPQTAEAAE